MVQDLNQMRFCEQCKMNVFPSRQKFNLKIFAFFMVLVLIFFAMIEFIMTRLLSQIFFVIYFFWGFILLNPYLIFFGIQRKRHCPNCFGPTTEKNLEFKPFGEKEPEIYKLLAPIQKSPIIWYCPYCGNVVNNELILCNSCGKKFEISR